MKNNKNKMNEYWFSQIGCHVNVEIRNLIAFKNIFHAKNLANGR